MTYTDTAHAPLPMLRELAAQFRSEFDAEREREEEAARRAAEREKQRRDEIARATAVREAQEWVAAQFPHTLGKVLSEDVWQGYANGSQCGHPGPGTGPTAVAALGADFFLVHTLRYMDAGDPDSAMDDLTLLRPCARCRRAFRLPVWEDYQLTDLLDDGHELSRCSAACAEDINPF